MMPESMQLTVHPVEMLKQKNSRKSQQREQAADMIRNLIYGLGPDISLRAISRTTHVPIATVHDFKVRLLQEKRVLEMAAASARDPFLSRNHMPFLPPNPAPCSQERFQLPVQAQGHPQSLQVPQLFL
jgi:hypothetical protein